MLTVSCCAAVGKIDLQVSAQRKGYCVTVEKGFSGGSIRIQSWEYRCAYIPDTDDKMGGV